MIRQLTFLLAIAAPAVASATEPYCQIWGKSSGCAIRVDQGVAQILTCAHSKKAGEKVHVRFRRTDRWIEGRVTAIDVDRDLAIVRLQAPPRLKVVPIAEETPEDGTVTIYGYGKSEFQEHRTEIIGRQAANVKTLTRTEFIRVSGTGRPGDSGSPAVARGRIVGVHVAAINAGHDGLFVPVEDVHEFLREKAGWE